MYLPFLESFPEITEIMNVDLSGTSSILSGRRDPRNRAQDATLTKLPFEKDWFDCCLCTEVLEHIPDDQAAIRELARCLRPDATLLLSVPHVTSPYDPAHVRTGYTVEGLTSLLQTNGFSVLAVETCLSGWFSVLLRLWRLQKSSFKRNLMPRFVVWLFAVADRFLPVGRNWDLVFLTRKNL